MKRYQLIFWALIFLTVQASCTPESKGDFRFIGKDEVVDGKVLVYMYRRPSRLDQSALCNLMINDELVGGLHPGQYTFRFLPPGKTRFETADTSPAFVTVYLREGHEYFIRQTWHIRASGFQPLVECMTRVKAEIDLKLCSYVETPTKIEKKEEDDT